MRKILAIILCLNTITPVKAESYGTMLMEKKYRSALNAGCDDIRRKNPATATVLGLLPGGGSFYTGEIGLGIADLLLWPFSPIWDMPLAGKKAKEINMSETVYNCEELGKIK